MSDDELYPKYPHLENLDRVPEVLSAPWVHITEKIHGFNARFGQTASGTYWIGSRNNVIDPEREPLQGFTEWAKSRLDWVAPGLTIYGEWAGKGIQKGIDYGDKRFYLFAVRDGVDFRHPAGLPLFADHLDCLMAPVLHEGSVPTTDELDELRKGKSLLAEQQREGIVIVPWPPVYDKYGHQVIAKFKAPEFSERAHARREQPTPADLASVQAFVDDYATDERMGHVLDQVAELIQPNDPLSAEFTGDVLRAYHADVVREAGPDYEALSDEDRKRLGSVLNRAVKPLLDARRLAAIR